MLELEGGGGGVGRWLREEAGAGRGSSVARPPGGEWREVVWRCGKEVVRRWEGGAAVGKGKKVGETSWWPRGVVGVEIGRAHV